MPTIVSRSVFRGATGPFSVPADCENCGAVEVSFGLPTPMTPDVSMQDVLVDCPKCSAPARVRDGFYDFKRQIEEIIQRSNVSKKDAKRFIRKVETASDYEKIPTSVEAINKDLAEIAKLALKQPDRRSAFSIVCNVVKELIILGSAALVGLDAAGYEVKDLLQREDQPAFNIEDTKDQAQPKGESKVDDPPSKWPDITDVEHCGYHPL